MPRKCYDVGFKLRAIAVAESKSKEAAARQFKVDARRIREWCSQKDQLTKLKNDRGRTSQAKRLAGAGRKPLDEELEKELFDWIMFLRSQHMRVSRRMIREKAINMMAHRDPTSTFKASKGWLQLFLRRKALSLRRKTTVCQKTPIDVIPKLVSYVKHLRQLQVVHKFNEANIYAMDETACWMDMPSDTTIDAVGAKCVPLKTTGHEKDHFTVVLTARANGKKLKPFVVFKGKGTRLMKELKNITGIVIRFSSNGWMNDQLTAEYLHSSIGTLSFHKRLLVWDAYKCHISEATKEHITKMKIHTAVIPGGCTKFIQAPDVVWNAIFKAQLRRCYDVWLSEPSAHQFTKGGNMKAPSRSLLCEWVKTAWDSISEDTIKKSFISCAITTNLDGSDDDRIHCFKSGQPCEAGQKELEKVMENLTLDDYENPFGDDEDDEETEKNEACVDSDDDDDDDD